MGLESVIINGSYNLMYGSMSAAMNMLNIAQICPQIEMAESWTAPKRNLAYS